MSQQPTVSVLPERDESGQYRVTLVVTGIQTEQQALRLADILTAMMCGQEIQTQ